MAYFDVHLLANDQDFMHRSVACAATEGVPDEYDWAVSQRYKIAAAPGFGDAYASALAGGVEAPGRDQSVISDAQLLAQVRTVAAGG